MKKFSLVMAALLALAVLVTGCGKKDAGKSGNAAKAEGYTFGEGVIFHSDEPVTYTMFFSDASWYPMVETWKTEGIFKKIEELTNVKLDIISYDSGDYTNKIGLAINAGQSAYIVPKVYDENAFVDGGAVVAVSDYTQYMPNFTSFYNKYNMKKDVDTIVKSDGKFYRLPGMLEAPMQDYTLLLRQDLFEGAGIDIASLEQSWTWDDLYDALVKVKAYMVKQGIITEKEYVWSDLWCGATSGHGTGGNLLKLMGTSYGVPSGWAIEGAAGGLAFDFDKDEWYLASTTDNFKKFVATLNKFVKGGILDPETFTQDDNTAQNRFYNGKSAIISTNRGMYATQTAGLDTGIGKGNYKVYLAMTPVALNRYSADNTRLENGVMIAQRALDELGEAGFIKMMRFVDWLWYSPEAYVLYKWGVEGETFQYVKDETTGMNVKKLLPGFKCGGLGIGGEETDVDIRLQWGYAGGNFWYGHTLAEMSDNLSPTHQDFYARLAKYREVRPVNPSVPANEDEREQMKLWSTPLTDNINAWTLKFVTGQKDVEADWNEYIKSCENLHAQDFVKLNNEIYKRSK